MIVKSYPDFMPIIWYTDDMRLIDRHQEVYDMKTVFIISILLTVIVTWIVIAVTNKAYSRRWEDHDNEKSGQA